MIALVALLAGCVLAIAGWTWSARGVDGSARLALVVVLGIAATAFNVVVPIPDVEATTTIVLCAALALGAPTAAAVGIVAVVGTSLTGPIGSWTLWQIAATCLVAIVAALVGRPLVAGVVASRTGALLAFGALAAGLTIAFDVATTIPTTLTFAPPGTGESTTSVLLARLLLGIPFTVVHVVCVTSLSIMAGPPLVRALERARPRLTGGEILDVPDPAPIGGTDPAIASA